MKQMRDLRATIIPVHPQDSARLEMSDDITRVTKDRCPLLAHIPLEFEHALSRHTVERFDLTCCALTLAETGCLSFVRSRETSEVICKLACPLVPELT
jgi:hypothetical protein